MVLYSKFKWYIYYNFLLIVEILKINKEKKTRIASNQVFVPKVALKAQSHKNRFY